MSSSKFISLTIIPLLILIQPLYSNVINIPDDYESIQEGIDQADNGDTVLVAPGEYLENLDLTGKNLVLGSLYLTTDSSEYSELTIIDGDASGSVISIGNNEEDEFTVEVAGLTLINGSGRRWDIDDRNWYYGGGCFFAVNVTATLRHCLVIDNDIIQNDARGGGIYSHNGTLFLKDCEIRGNSCEAGNGGGLYAANSSVTIENSEISANSSAEYGGGIWAKETIIRLSGTSFGENTSENENHSGGMYLSECAGNMDSCSFVENEGAIWLHHDNEFVIANCLFIRNYGEHGGAIYSCSGGQRTISNCTFQDNTSEIGGAVYLYSEGDNFTFKKCFFMDNTAEFWGGALYLKLAEVDLINCTIYGNSADLGDAISCGGNGSPLLQNCIVYGNGDTPVAFRSETNSNLLVAKYSLIEGGENNVELNDAGELNWRFGNIDQDPLFTDTDNGNFNLTEESPCIDTGDPDSPDDPDGTRADMGAFYFSQRLFPDIIVNPVEVAFEAVAYGEIDSLPLFISNVGDTTLHVTDYLLPLHMTSVFPRSPAEEEFPLEIEPDSTYTQWIIFQPDTAGVLESGFVILSDDPDEPEVEISLTGEVLSVIENTIIPTAYTMLRTYPNPFNSTVNIAFSLPQAGLISLKLFDILGRETAVLDDAFLKAGDYSKTFDAGNLKTGVYFVALTTNGKTISSKVILMR